MGMRGTAAVLALIVTAILVGLALMPEYLFFLIIGGGVMLGGLVLLKKSIAWGIALLVIGAGLAAIGVKAVFEHRRAEEEEAEKTEQEVQRRVGMFRRRGEEE